MHAAPAFEKAGQNTRLGTVRTRQNARRSHQQCRGRRPRRPASHSHGRTQFAPTVFRKHPAEKASPLSIFICVSVGETCGLPRANTVRPYRVPKTSGRENKPSADIYMCICRGDLRSPAGEHSSPLPCSENIRQRKQALCRYLYVYL